MRIRAGSIWFYRVFLLLGLAELVNAEWLHWWIPTPGEIPALILIVGSVILREVERD